MLIGITKEYINMDTDTDLHFDFHLSLLVLSPIPQENHIKKKSHPPPIIIL